MLVDAEGIVDGAYTRLGGLYDSPGAPDTHPPAPGVTRREAAGPDEGR
ncbi:hypothetical protein [Streptomyces sp. NPDC002785]